MIATLTRLIKGSLGPRPPGRRPPSLQELQLIRTALLHCVEDCDSNGAAASRLRQKIETAKSAQELWLLRNDAYQLVSQHHTQAVAAERINALIHFFEGILDPRQLVRIR